MKLFKKIKKKIKVLIFSKINPTWGKIEYFNPEWKDRIKRMARYIGETDSVVDLGCGQQWLREFLSPTNKYTGVDYRRRNSETMVCNFNRQEYPNVKADVYFISGCLEYVEDYEKFIENIVSFCRRCIISYCCMEDFPDKSLRRQRAWVNDLTKEQLIEAFVRRGMKLTCEDKTPTHNSIFVFDK